MRVVDAAAHLQAEWARLVLASIADAGVHDVVSSPGSRSTPFVLAAARHPRLRVWDLVDERSAAYFALGRGRVTGRPALLVSTSGTAAANYLPAVVEAGMSEVPLLILTADRPPELRDCGANQTIDQQKLYGGHGRHFVDLGLPRAAPRALRALRRQVAQAVLRTLYPEAGAVHLNAPATKPLEPRPASSPAAERLAAAVDELLARPIVKPSLPRRLAAERDLEELAGLCRRRRRGLIVCGPGAVAQVAERPLLSRVAELTGFPIYCEPASQGRFRGAGRSAEGGALWVDALDTLLHSPRFCRALEPRLILQLGRAPTSGAWQRFLEAHAGVDHWLIAGGWADPQSTATRLVLGDLGPALKLLEARLAERRDGPDAPRTSAWSATFRRGEELAWEAVAGELEAATELSEGVAAHTVVSALPPGTLLALGNSLPIRQVDTWCRGDLADAAVWSQRGASGIDGIVSGAAGAADAWGGATALVVGDLSLLHDLGGLAAARRLERPLVIVVVQNRGGRIFEQLPVATDPAVGEEIFDHWVTPHDLDFAHAAALYRLPFARAATRGELAAALGQAFAHPGASLVEAIVPPHGAAEENGRLWRRIDEALAADSE